MSGIAPPDEASRALVAWLVAAGIDVSAVEVVKAADGERELRARRALRDGDEVLRIPWDYFLTTIQAWAAPPELDLAARLTAHVAAEARREHSPYGPYMESLPRSLDHLPLYWGAEEMALLRGSQLPGRLAALREDLHRDHASLPGLTWEELCWAHAVVISRAFGVTVEGRRQQVLIPLVDMMNHSDAPDVQGNFDREDGAFVITALRDIAAGEELRCRYSRNCNRYYLLGYGFCEPDNLDNTAVLRVAGREFEVRASPAGSEELFAHLRRACATPRELALRRRRMRSPVGTRNERAVLHTVMALAEEALAQFDTTIDEDDALLAGPLPRTHRACILFRRGEKRVLQAHVDLARALLPLLRLPAGAFCTAAARHADAETWVGWHLRSLLGRTPPAV